MNKKETSRWMKRIIIFCLSICALFSVASFIALWFGIDETDTLRLVLGLFGSELLMTCLIKLVEGKIKEKETVKNDAEQSDI